MSWLQKLASGTRNFVRSLKGAPFVAVYGGVTGWWSGRTASMDKLMEQYRGWVFKCISKIAEEIGAIEIRLYKKNGSGDRKQWEEVEDHDILSLLHAPNQNMMRSELFQLWSMHDDLTGNCYWLLEDVRKPDDQPSGIKVLNPRYVRVRVDMGMNEVVRYEYEYNGKITIYQPFQIIHFRRPNPNNPFVGVGPTEAALDSIDALNWAQDWNKRFFQNGAMPGLILETEQTDETMIRLLRETFEDRFQGQDKAHRTAVLPRGVKIADKGNLTQKDMDFSDLLVKMRDAILAAFGVPAVILGLGLGETINRASAETLEYVFALHTIKPKMRRFVMFLNAYLVSRYGDEYVLDFDDPVPANVELQINQDKASLGNAPYKSVNEVRAERGLPPIEGGDAVMGSALLTPVGTVTPTKGSPRTSFEQKSIKKITSFIERRAKPRKALADDIATKIVGKIKEARAAALKELTTTDWEPKWEALVKRASKYESDIKREMAVYAAGMTERAEQNVKEATKDIDITKLLDRDNEVAAIIKLLGPTFQKILEQEGKSAAEMVDAAFDATEERMQESLAKGLKLMADKYTEETLSLLKDALEEGISNGDSLPELKKRVQEVGEFSASERAATVAKTEAFRVANFSTKEAWKQSGVVTEIKWYTAKDEEVCQFCGPMDGEVVGIEENFFDKGDEVEGRDGVTMDLKYSDVEAPPLHPNCRCYIRPETVST